MTRGFDDMIMNGEKSSFSRMMFDIGRLERIEEVVGRQVVNNTTLSVSFDKNERWDIGKRAREQLCYDDSAI